MKRFLGLVLLASVACGGGDLKGEGEECIASSECAEGLTCNFGETPPVCRTMQTPVPDAAPRIDADPAAPDAGPPPDASPPGTPDAAPLPDVAVPDATPIPDAAVPDAT